MTTATDPNGVRYVDAEDLLPEPEHVELTPERERDARALEWIAGEADLPIFADVIAERLAAFDPIAWPGHEWQYPARAWLDEAAAARDRAEAALEAAAAVDALTAAPEHDDTEQEDPHARTGDG